MRSDERQAFSEFLTSALGFWGQNVNSFSLSVWWQATEHLTLEQVRQAFTAHALDPDRGQFAPKPADLVRQLEGSHQDRALGAWSKIHEAMKRVGARQSVVFDDAVIHSAVEDIGGWTAICRSEVDELQWLQKRFIEAYAAAARSKRTHPSKLVGEHEADNRLRGHPVAPPVLVGDQVKAREVLHSSAEPTVMRLAH